MLAHLAPAGVGSELRSEHRSRFALPVNAPLRADVPPFVPSQR